MGSELEMLELVARGKSNRDIASALLLSETAVRGCLKRILEQLRVGSAAQAIDEAKRRRLIQL